MKAVETGSWEGVLEPLTSAVRITIRFPEGGTVAVADGPSSSGT